MTTELRCTAHPEGHIIPTGTKFSDCADLLGKVIIDNVVGDGNEDGDDLTYIFASSREFSAEKRVKLGETLSGNKAHLPGRIISISVRA